MEKLLTSILLFLTLSSFAQTPFQSISLNDAQQKAKAEGKLIFLQFEAADCNQCKDVAAKGLDNKELEAQMEQHFVCLCTLKKMNNNTRLTD
jgi:thioredoxin-related protein